MRHAVPLCLAAACLLAPGVATAATGSIVYPQDDQLWMTTPDGAHRHHVSAERGLLTPSMADDGTIMAVDVLARTLVRRTPAGVPIGSPVATSTTNVAGSDVRYDGPDLAAISPRRIPPAPRHPPPHTPPA